MADPVRRYLAREVAHMLGLKVSQVRAWARAGLVSPGRGPRGELCFSFPDLVLLRMARDLIAARLPPARVRRALRRLRSQLPSGRSLSEVRITADGERVVVRDGEALWSPESGQALLDFEVSPVTGGVVPIKSGAPVFRGNADELFDRGCDLEEGSPELARAAYRRALELDPDHCDSNLNLGRLLHEAGEPAAAERHYRHALLARPRDPTALFNLGVALEDQARPWEALASYEACLTVDPRHADAHHNAARLCEQLGRRAQALRHLAEARRLFKSE